jgi:DNA mismatch endonuclease (patch repair protein)
MTDIFTPAQRSALMAKVRGSGNASTELRLAALFRTLGITGWRRKFKLPGKPDFVFPARKLAVFVDGCFWHGCPIHATQPKQNAEFWQTKISKNQARDRLVNRTLRAQGWRVLRIWEHELSRKREKRLLARLRRVGLLE